MRTHNLRSLQTASTLCCVAVLLLASTASAKTYQVGQGKAYATLGALPGLVGGDIVEVDGGHTYAGGIQLRSSGSSANPITLRGIPVGGKRPVFSGGTNTIEIY